jgi:hypothetical protein
MSIGVNLALTLRASSPYVQRVRAYGELSTGKTFCRVAPIRTPPVRRVLQHPAGLMNAEKSLAESSGGFLCLQVPAPFDSHFTHDATLR